MVQKAHCSHMAVRGAQGGAEFHSEAYTRQPRAEQERGCEKGSACGRSRGGGLRLDPQRLGPQLPPGFHGTQALDHGTATVRRHERQVRGVVEYSGLRNSLRRERS